MGLAPTAQFLRTVSLLLMNGSYVLDLSAFRIKFQVSASDVDTPNTARIRVYNVSENTWKSAIEEYNQVTLQAGYQDNLAQIFNGTIKQFRRGKERNIDSYLDIYAADGDVARNFGVINQSLKAGSTPDQQLNALAGAMGTPLDKNAPSQLSGQLTAGGILPQPRGKVFYGLARSYLRDLGTTYNARWSIQNGKLTVISLTGYLPGEVVVISSATGMIGVPEATEQGITVKTLLNPQMQVGQRVQINNRDITATTIKEQFFPGYTDLNLIAQLDASNDGFYRVVVVEHEGDTRGQEWWSDLVCLSINQGAPDASVFPYGLPPAP